MNVHMQRTLPLAILAFVLVLVLAVPAAAEAKSSVKLGTYRGTTSSQLKLTILVKREECRDPHNQGSLKRRICVTLSSSPEVLEKCSSGQTQESYFGNFLTPVELPTSDRLLQRTHTYTGSQATGDSTFSVTFKTNGTASGYIEQSEQQQGEPSSQCTTGRLTFKAKR